MRFPLLLLASSLFASAALAQGEPGLRELMDARSLGMGGAYRGLGLSADAVNGNPAAMSAFKRYQVEITGVWDPGYKYAYGSATVLDSQTNPMAAGLSYHLVSFGRGEERRTAHINTVALGFPLADALHIGVSAHHLLMTGAVEANAITGDAGVLLRLFEALQIGASAHNLIDIHHPEMSRYYTFSAAFMLGLFSAAVDVRADFERPEGQTWMLNAGAEYVFGNGFPLRAGYTFDSSTGQHYLSGGLGFFTEGGGIDIGYRHELNGSGRFLALTVRMQP